MGRVPLLGPRPRMIAAPQERDPGDRLLYRLAGIAPGGVVRAVGGSGASALTASQRVSNRRFHDATGWAPAYPSVREGWVAVAAARGGANKEDVDDR